MKPSIVRSSEHSLNCDHLTVLPVARMIACNGAAESIVSAHMKEGINCDLGRFRPARRRSAYPYPNVDLWPRRRQSEIGCIAVLICSYADSHLPFRESAARGRFMHSFGSTRFLSCIKRSVCK